MSSSSKIDGVEYKYQYSTKMYGMAEKPQYLNLENTEKQLSI